MKSMDKIIYCLVFFFLIGVIIGYYSMHTVPYDSFKEAVKKTANGGKILDSYDFDKGTFVFFYDTNKKYEYYYLQDKKWYNKGIIYAKTYEVEDYKVTVYYVQRNKLSFIQVESEEELKNLTDSLNTEYIELSLHKKEHNYFGGTYKQLPDDYFIYINDKEYLLKEHNSLFKLFT